ncbi:MAG: radical SAM protein, partial [Candidatus Baltobacteraceae bacterium]
METVRRVGRLRCVEVEAKSVLNRVRGMPFGWSVNPYRGCHHRCVFCYARRTHEFLERDGVSEWGSLISVKINAPEVLRRELASPSWNGDEVAIGTATDPYQPLEGRYRITRRILQELVRARTPASLITRSPLVLRDADVLRELALAAGVDVSISLPTLDADLARRIEPAVAPPRQRLRAIRALARAGIPVGIAVAPVLPHLTDDPASLRAVYAAAADAGASFTWRSLLNLGEVARDAFFAFLHDEFPALVPEYERLYRTKYAPQSFAEEIERRAGAARASVRLE